MPATSRTCSRSAQRRRAASLRRHPGQRPCHRRHFARSRPRTASSARRASAVPAPRPRAACSACSKRTAACHQSSTSVAFGSTSRCSRHSPASPSHSTVAGVSAPTPAAASACRNASDAVAWPLRDEGEAVLGAIGVDHLARDHLEVAPLPPVPVAHVAAIEPDHDGAGRLRRGLVRGLGGMRLHDVLRRPAASGCAPCPRSAPRRAAAARTAGRRPCRTAPAPHTAPSRRPVRARPRPRRGRARRRSSPRPRPGRGRRAAAGPAPARRRTASGTWPGNGPCWPACARTPRTRDGTRPPTATCAGTIWACSAAVSRFASASRSPSSARPASSSRSMRATSVSVVTPGSRSATSFTRHTSFATSSPSSREPGTYPEPPQPPTGLHALAAVPKSAACPQGR